MKALGTVGVMVAMLISAAGCAERDNRWLMRNSGKGRTDRVDREESAPAAAPEAAANQQVAEAPPPKPVVFDPKVAAARFPTGESCEAAARSLLPARREDAWAMLKVCINRGKFTAIRELSSDAWAEELRTRKEAAD